MNAQIVKLKTRIENQKKRIADLERQMKAERLAADEGYEKDAASIVALEEDVTYQKRRVANRDKKIKELKDE